MTFIINTGIESASTFSLNLNAPLEHLGSNKDTVGQHFILQFWLSVTAPHVFETTAKAIIPFHI